MSDATPPPGPELDAAVCKALGIPPVRVDLGDAGTFAAYPRVSADIADAAQVRAALWARGFCQAIEVRYYVSWDKSERNVEVTVQRNDIKGMDQCIHAIEHLGEDPVRTEAWVTCLAALAAVRAAATGGAAGKGER